MFYSSDEQLLPIKPQSVESGGREIAGTSLLETLREISWQWKGNYTRQLKIEIKTILLTTVSEIDTLFLAMAAGFTPLLCP